LRLDMINAARDLARRSDAAGFARKIRGVDEDSPLHATFLAEVEALRGELAAAEPFHPGRAVAWPTRKFAGASPSSTATAPSTGKSRRRCSWWPTAACSRH